MKHKKTNMYTLKDAKQLKLIVEKRRQDRKKDFLEIENKFYTLLKKADKCLKSI